MQLKRLRKTGAVGSQPADDSKTTQDISESQLLRDLDDLTGGLAADGGALDAAATVAGSTATPAAGTRCRGRSSGLTSSAKRQRREFKSVFGSQEDEPQQHQQLGGGLGLGGSDVQQGQVSMAAECQSNVCGSR